MKDKLSRFFRAIFKVFDLLNISFIVHLKHLLMKTVAPVIIRSILMEGKIVVALDIKQ